MGAFRQNREATERGISREETGIALSFCREPKARGLETQHFNAPLCGFALAPFSDIQAAVSEIAFVPEGDIARAPTSRRLESH
jgi:hypothetical protein